MIDRLQLKFETKTGKTYSSYLASEEGSYTDAYVEWLEGEIIDKEIKEYQETMAKYTHVIIQHPFYKDKDGTMAMCDVTKINDNIVYYTHKDNIDNN